MAFSCSNTMRAHGVNAAKWNQNISQCAALRLDFLIELCILMVSCVRSKRRDCPLTSSLAVLDRSCKCADEKDKRLCERTGRRNDAMKAVEHVFLICSTHVERHREHAEDKFDTLAKFQNLPEFLLMILALVIHHPQTLRENTFSPQSICVLATVPIADPEGKYFFPSEGVPSVYQMCIRHEHLARVVDH